MVQLAYDLCPGKFEVGPITPTDGESTKVKVKVKVDLHGQLTVESAHTVTKVNRGLRNRVTQTASQVTAQ